MKYLLKFVLLGLILLWSGNAYSSQPPLQNNNAKQDKKVSEYHQVTNDKEHPLIITTIKASNGADDTNKEAREHCRKNVIGFGTLFIAIITAIILILQRNVFIRQANLMNKTISEMKKATDANKLAADASKKYSDMLPQVERAYCHPGGWFHNNGTEFFSDVGNYGKTKAMIKRICVEVCERSELPEVPNYSNIELVDLPLYPGQLPQSSRIENRTRKGIKDPVVYGRVWYEDIFGDEHTSGFVYDVDDKGGTHAIKAPPAYTHCD